MSSWQVSVQTEHPENLLLPSYTGEEGVTRSSVGHSLGLTAKKANRNLSAFAAKFGIREAFAQQGKAQIKVRIISPLSFGNTQSNIILVQAHQAGLLQSMAQGSVCPSTSTGSQHSTQLRHCIFSARRNAGVRQPHSQ